MFVNQHYKTDVSHIMFVGTNIKEQRFSYTHENLEIGYVVVFMENDGDMYLDYFEVKEEHRKKGWGTKMVNELFSIFPVTNRIYGKADFDNEIKFWSKQIGYKPMGEGHDEDEGYFWFELLKSQ